MHCHRYVRRRRLYKPHATSVAAVRIRAKASDAARDMSIPVRVSCGQDTIANAYGVGQQMGSPSQAPNEKEGPSG